jgi:hypothetical protein
VPDKKRLALEAISILGLMPKGEEVPSPTWLVVWDGEKRGKQGAVKWMALAELGRMARDGIDHSSIRAYAAAIAPMGLTDKEAAARLRYVRLNHLAMPP